MLLQKAITVTRVIIFIISDMRSLEEVFRARTKVKCALELSLIESGCDALLFLTGGHASACWVEQVAPTVITSDLGVQRIQLNPRSLCSSALPRSCS